MPTRTRGRKRKRSIENEAEINTNHNKKQKIETNDNAPPHQLVALSEYFCCVCKELSCCRIFQCPNGCIICENCYPRITPCKCPLCRETMNKNKPIRCRIAERTLALRLVQCKYKGCEQQIMFGDLNKHELNQCEYKPIDCKYKVLGCQWKGLRSDQKQHEAQCKCDQEETLRIVEALQNKLKYYNKFCNDTAEIHCSSYYINSEKEFETNGREFLYEGYDFQVHVKSEKKGNKNKEIYQLYFKVVFAEDADHFSIGESVEADFGIVLEPHGSGASCFVKEKKVIITSECTQTEWYPFEPQLGKTRYTAMFKGGFDLKVFYFLDDL